MGSFLGGRTSAVSFHVHRHYLERFIRSGQLALDAGGGPGRFTIELAKPTRQPALGSTCQLGPASPACTQRAVDIAYAADIAALGIIRS